MLDQHLAQELYDLAEFNSLRAEALALFERCLSERTPLLLEQFVQQQLLADPPQLDLLLQVAADVHQHLIILQESRFDVRNWLLARLLADHAVDLSELLPPNALEEFHRLHIQVALAYIVRRYPHFNSSAFASMGRTIHTALLTAAQLQGDILMTRRLLAYILEWVDSVSLSSIRGVWGNIWEPLASPHIH